MPSTIIPTLRYRNALAMLDWLCEAFGFVPHLVVEDEAGGIAHAQLLSGPGMIMLASAREDAFGKLQGTPEALGGTMQSAYVIVGDVDKIHDRAKQKGAEIVMEPFDADYGGRGFSCRDPEGHLWSFGSYDPWSEQET